MHNLKIKMAKLKGHQGGIFLDNLIKPLVVGKF